MNINMLTHLLDKPVKQLKSTIIQLEDLKSNQAIQETNLPRYPDYLKKAELLPPNITIG